MRPVLASLEFGVILLGILSLLIDLWLPAEKKRSIGYFAAAGLLILSVGSAWPTLSKAYLGFGETYVLDNLALFFKSFFLMAAALVMLMSVQFSNRIESGISEYYSLVLFALAGMMFAASANDFTMLFVSIELISVTFYVLTSFQHSKLQSLEAGIKYLVLSALASAFLVFGIALVYGTSSTMNFVALSKVSGSLATKPVFLAGLLLVLVGLGFKIAAFPFQIWAPDVYQGAPTPTTAFLAIGSKGAGIVLMLRVLLGAVPDITVQWPKLLMILSAVTILYGSLCAIPQRNLKRLMGYSSIANAGYFLLGFTALSAAGTTAILYYLAGYLFTVAAAFSVITLVTQDGDSDDISVLAGLSDRSPLLAAALTLAMGSLAGIPPLAGFFGKFLLFRAVLEKATVLPLAYGVVAVAVFGVVVSLYYYFGIIRAIYWSKTVPNRAPFVIPPSLRFSLYLCMAGIVWLGVYPAPMERAASRAVRVFRFANDNQRYALDPSLPNR